MKITPHYPTLIVCCLVCQQHGDPNPPVLGRFAQYPDGTVEPEASTINRAAQRRLYPYMIATPHQRPDGGVTWKMPHCPQGHYRPVRLERLVAEFERIPAGQNDVRVCL